MVEQERANDRDLAEAGNGDRLQTLDRGADVVQADKGAEANAEDRQREAGGDLVGE